MQEAESSAHVQSNIVQNESSEPKVRNIQRDQSAPLEQKQPLQEIHGLLTMATDLPTDAPFISFPATKSPGLWNAYMILKNVIGEMRTSLWKIYYIIRCNQFPICTCTCDFSQLIFHVLSGIIFAQLIHFHWLSHLNTSFKHVIANCPRIDVVCLYITSWNAPSHVFFPPVMWSHITQGRFWAFIWVEWHFIIYYGNTSSINE